MILDPWPIRRQQNDHTNFPVYQILLIAKVLVCCDKRIKPLGFSATKQVPVFESASTFFIGCLYEMIRQVTS